MTKFANDESAEVARKRVEEDRAATDRSRHEFVERMKGKPTPTQEENDLAAHGAHILEHEPDGSGPDPFVTRNMEAKPHSGGYETRANHPAQHEHETRAVNPASRPTPAAKPPARSGE